MFHVKQPFDITGFQLKVVAIIAMTCNHVANVFGVGLLGSPLCFALYAVGGITFPIMAFLVVEGYVHTSNLRKYALRLALFAVISQVPYHLVFGQHLNVMFTLLLGLGILWLCDRFNPAAGLLAAVAGTALLHGAMDWGTDGLVIIYLFGTLRKIQRPSSQSALREMGNGQNGRACDQPALTGLTGARQEIVSRETSQERRFDQEVVSCETCHERRAGLVAIIGTMLVPMVVTVSNALRYANAYTAGYALVGYTAAAALLCGYRGRRGRSMKWFFYAYYPLHLLVLWLISLAFM